MSDAAETVPDNPLLQFPVEAPPANDPLAWVNNLPTTIRDLEMFDLPAKSPGGSSVNISTKIPEQWMEAIRQIRDQPGTMLPRIFLHNGLFFRWAVARGIKDMYGVSVHLKESGEIPGSLDPTIQAAIFVDVQTARTEAESRTVNSAADQLVERTRAVLVIMRAKEYSRAADLINSWIDGARGLDDPYWQHLFVKMMLDQPEIHEPLRTLIDMGLIVDEPTLLLAKSHGIISELPGFMLEADNLNTLEHFTPPS